MRALVLFVFTANKCTLLKYRRDLFYEWRLPLSKLGVTESYIRDKGIGLMVIDTYGQGAIGSTPHDPTTLDNAFTAYSKDSSTSAEKGDKDVFTYKHA